MMGFITRSAEPLGFVTGIACWLVGWLVTDLNRAFTHTDCDPYVTDPSTRQGRRPMTYKTKIFCYKAKI
jgi:hypothetical protein